MSDSDERLKELLRGLHKDKEEDSMAIKPKEGETISKMQDQLAKLRDDLERAKAGSPASPTTSASSDSDSVSREKALEEELARLRARKKEEPAAVLSASDSKKREDALKKDLEAMRKRLADMTAGKSSSSSSSSDSATDKIEILRKKKEELERKARDLDGSSSSSSDSARRMKALEERKKYLSGKLDALPSMDDLSSTKASEKAKLDKLLRGIDVCFLMDCTGSMSSFITAAKTKIKEIIDNVLAIDETAIMRIAFVGYRDYGDGDRQYEKVDFVEKEELKKITDKLADCPAMGGGDGPEDIPGGLKIVNELSWNSSTRLMIHFGDYPCHGTKYHNFSTGGDTYPTGDPKGLIPEDLLRDIIKKRIDYYFMKITNHTDKMMAIFQEVFKETGKEIYVNPIGANAADFVPQVVNSISSSMARSAARKGLVEPKKW